jgi:hypothetical protein
MADCLSHLRSEALLNRAPNPQFLTMATLTGHGTMTCTFLPCFNIIAGRSFGPYTVLIENGPSKKNGVITIITIITLIYYYYYFH